jgi:hypothetical protein
VFFPHKKAMLKQVYKHILKKLNLSQKQLEILSNSLAVENICAGKFIREGKACPNTTALKIKLDEQQILRNEEACRLLRTFGVSRFDLALFYLLFDIPALVARRVSENQLETFRTAVKELWHEQTRV